MKLFVMKKPSKLVDSVYEIHPNDEYLAKLRELKVAKLKKDMGNKYLLAVPVQRNTNLENEDDRNTSTV